jgi:hypothetical protein
VASAITAGSMPSETTPTSGKPEVGGSAWSGTVTGRSRLVLLYGWPQTSYAWRHATPLHTSDCHTLARDVPLATDEFSPRLNT